MTFDRLEGALIVRLSGEIDHDQCADLDRAIRDQMEPDDDALLVNLADVTFCGSSGLALFVQLQAHADRSATRFALVRPSPIIKAMIAVCGLSDLRTWDDTEAAEAFDRRDLAV